jgi:hypothetical protein
MRALLGQASRHALVEALDDARSTIAPAARSDSACSVKVGLYPDPVGSGPPSTHHRFSTSWKRCQRSTTEVRGSSPMRSVPRT